MNLALRTPLADDSAWYTEESLNPSAKAKTLANVFISNPLREMESVLAFVSKDKLTPPSANSPLVDNSLDKFLIDSKIPAESGSSSSFWLNRLVKPLSVFNCVYKVEGIVTSVHDTFFTARLVDLLKDLPDEDAEFPIEEITEDERTFVSPGSVFYWSIGYELHPSGQRKRSSVIRFRRLPMWSAKDIARVKEDVAELSFLLK